METKSSLTDVMAKGKCYVTQGTQYSTQRQPGGLGVGGGREEVQEEGVICILVAGSCCCMAKVNNIVKQLSSTQKEILKKEPNTWGEKKEKNG